MQLRPVVREETRVDGEREKGSGREEANRWIERMGLVRESKRETRREGDRKRSTRGSEKRKDKAARSGAARSGARSAVADGGEEGKREAREGRGMLRSRGNRLPSERALLSFSSYRSGLPALALS